MGGGNTASFLSRVDILSIDYGLVSLRESRNFGSEGVNRLSSPSSDMKGDGGVEEGQRDEEFLPDKSIDDLDEHASKFVEDIALLISFELYSFHSFSKSRQVLFDNEIGIVLGDDNLDKERDNGRTNGEGHHQREPSRYQGSKGDEVHMRDVSCVKHLSPLVDRLGVEHLDEIVSDLNSGLVPWSDAQFGQNGGLGEVADRSLMGYIGNDSDHVVVKTVAIVSVRSVPES